MKSISCAAAILGLFLVAGSGCNQNATPAQAPQAGVAVIDLDAIAKELGKDKQIANAIQQRQQALNKKLVELANAYIEQLEQHRKANQADPKTSEVTLVQYEKQANQSLGVAKRQAQQDLSNHRGRLVKQFRDAVRPTAREVAKERGLGVIVTRQDGLLFDCARECDITDAVLQRLQERTAMAAQQPPAPTNR